MDHWAKRACTVLLCAGTHFLPAQTFTTIYNFCAKAGCTDGQSPGASLVQATDGNLYGTTRLGGANGKGTVFRITPSGALTTLYSFCSLPACADGEGPTAGLVQAADGNLYGITAGGADSLGTVFQITPAGTLTTLHTFCPETGCTDGYGPYGGLVEVPDGNLYGTTEWGGVYGLGTVFKITPAGVLTRLHSFCSGKGCAEGWNPVATLLEGTSGALYGTTLNGGPGDGKGTVFKITQRSRRIHDAVQLLRQRKLALRLRGRRYALGRAYASRRRELIRDHQHRRQWDAQRHHFQTHRERPDNAAHVLLRTQVHGRRGSLCRTHTGQRRQAIWDNQRWRRFWPSWCCVSHYSYRKPDDPAQFLRRERMPGWC